MKRFVVAVLLVTSVLVPSGEARSGTAPHWKAWLCFPGRPHDYCNLDPYVTIVAANGVETTQHVSAPQSPPLDCFYVYPTVSEQKRANSTLAVQVDEAAVAFTQASPFSSVCRVYAPMYRQVTAYAGTCSSSGTCIKKGNFELEYDDVLAAWRTYIERYNDGRPFVLIGHSEGSFILKRVLADVIERSSERKQFVSAILLGGDVVVKDGSTRGGDFTSIPSCRSETETGCVVAYSTWNRTPPKDARFQQVESPSSEHVLCVNPAGPGSARSLPITPLFPNIDSGGIIPTPAAAQAIVWYAFPDLYTARCVQQGPRAWLLITRLNHPGDPRPTVQPILPPAWGLHAADVNIALANLVALVLAQTHAWLAHK